MARPDLLRFDDVLLRAARLAGLLWLGGLVIVWGVWLNAPPDLEQAVAQAAWITALLATAPIGLLVAGLRLRRRESRAWALLRMIDEHVEVPSRDLLRDSDWTPTSLERAIRDLNNAGVSFLVWDREAGLVQDGRLRRTRIQIDECGSCSAKVSVTVAVGSVEPPRCPYCDGPLCADRILEEKARLIEELDGGAAARRARAASNGNERNFSIALFVILCLVFWPLGVAYALYSWHASPPPD